jgi:protein-tyrosine phosphatase
MLSNDPAHRWALEADPEVRARNRYMNVQAWANSRIHLRVPEGECDFINASPIVLADSLSREERRYIATQVCGHPYVTAAYPVANSSVKRDRK